MPLHYMYHLPEWPHFQWERVTILSLLAEVRYRQGSLLGRMEALGFALQAEATLQTSTLEVIKSSEIEGEILNQGQVRSSIARKLGMDVAGLVPSDRHVDGVVEMVLDATQNYTSPLSAYRLFSWHAALFPTGWSGLHKIEVGQWRKNDAQHPMQVVSGAMGKEQVHFEAPSSEAVPEEMQRFLEWFNNAEEEDALVKAAIAHLWFLTIHPFDDGNGRIARAITDMQLARADGLAQRFYSMSAQIQLQRKDYYQILEQTQKGSMDITAWLIWFLNCLHEALLASETSLSKVIRKAEHWQALQGKSLNPRQVLMINKLLDGFEGKLTTSKWAKIAKCSTDSALRDITDLMEKGILEKEASGGRSTSYRLVAL